MYNVQNKYPSFVQASIASPREVGCSSLRSACSHCLSFVGLRCGAVVKHRTRDREVLGSIPTNIRCGFFP